MKFEGRWFYCELCGTVAIKMPCCGNTSCNGGGCDKCDKDWEEAREMIHNGTAPSADSIPHAKAPTWGEES